MTLSSEQIKRLFDIFAQHNSDPKIELYYTNNFTLTVAVVLSAQTTDVSVNKVTTELFKTISTPWNILNLGLENLQQTVRSIGLYKTKSKNIILMSEKLINDKDGIIPCDFDYLLTLPGIGRKSANVILNTAFDMPTIAVDTHVNRVSNRIGLVNTNNLLKIELELNSIIPIDLKKTAHHWIVLHGRYTCKAIKPRCNECSVEKICQFNRKNYL